MVPGSGASGEAGRSRVGCASQQHGRWALLLALLLACEQAAGQAAPAESSSIPTRGGAAALPGSTVGLPRTSTGKGGSEKQGCASCPTTLDPVCGDDAVEYANACIATCQGVSIVAGGGCAPSALADGAAVSSSVAQVAARSYTAPSSGLASRGSSTSARGQSKGGSSVGAAADGLAGGLEEVSFATMTSMASRGFRYVGLADVAVGANDNGHHGPAVQRSEAAGAARGADAAGLGVRRQRVLQQEVAPPASLGEGDRVFEVAVTWPGGHMYVRPVAPEEAQARATAAAGASSTPYIPAGKAPDSGSGSGSDSRSRRRAVQEADVGDDSHAASGAGDGSTAGGASSGGSRRSAIVVGTDDRTQVYSDQFPWSAVAYLEYTEGAPADRYCTGALVGPAVGLTAAQCLYNRGTRKFMRVDSFSPGLKRSSSGGKQAPNGVAAVTTFTTWQGWTNNTKRAGVESVWAYNLAVLYLDWNIGDGSGWFGFRATCDATSYSMTLAGYADDKPQYSRWASQCTTDFSNLPGPCEAVSMRHTCDTYFGNTGSPMWDAGFYVVAIHHNEVLPQGAPAPKDNGATALRPVFVDAILAANKEHNGRYPPPGPPGAKRAPAPSPAAAPLTTPCVAPYPTFCNGDCYDNKCRQCCGDTCCGDARFWSCSADAAGKGTCTCKGVVCARNCCEQGSVCCGRVCCRPNTVCCKSRSTCCASGQVCCNSGNGCCAPGSGRRLFWG